MAKLVFGLNQSLDGTSTGNAARTRAFSSSRRARARAVGSLFNLAKSGGPAWRKARSHPCATLRRMEKSEIGTNRQLLDIFPFFSDGGRVARSMPESGKAPWVES
jgi:hypothetical protein